MRKLLLVFIVAFAFSSVSNAQERFTYNQNGLTDYVVVEIDRLTQDEIFKRSHNWIKENYENPDEVLKASIDNEKIRFNGSNKNGITIKILGIPTTYRVNYTIEILIKDGKYQFNPTQLSYYVPSSSHGSGKDVNLLTNCFYNKKGALRKTFKNIPPQIEELMNSLNNSLKNYIEKGHTDKW